MSMLTTIYLDGELGHLFGRKWKLRVSTPAEALRAIEANKPGIAAYLARSGEAGIDWRIRMNGQRVREECVHFRRPGSKIRITPVVRGAKSQAFGIILGIALVALTWGAGAGYLGVGAQAFFGSAAFGIQGLTVASLVGGIGISMAIGGIAQLISPQPKQSASDPGKPSYVFGGPATVTQQGGPVPLCYGGPIIVGPTRISEGVYSEEVAATKLPTDDDLPGPDPLGEGGFSVDPTLSAYSPASPTSSQQQIKAREIQTLQVARLVDLLCEGEIAGLCDAEGTILAYNDRLKACFFDRTPVRGADGTLAFTKFSTAFRYGTAMQDWMPGFPVTEQEISVGAEVVKGSDKITNAVQRQIAAGAHDAVRITIRLPALFQYDNSGNRNGAIVHITIQAKVSTDSTWKEVVGSAEANGQMDGLIGGEAVQEVVMSYRLPLSGANTWDVRVIRETDDAADPQKLASRTFWDSYTLVTDRKLRYPHSVIAATELSAQSFHSIPELAWRLKGKLVRIPSNYDPDSRDYTGAWDGSFAGCPLTLSADYTSGTGVLAVDATTVDLPDNALIEITTTSKMWQAHIIGAHAAGVTSLAITPIPSALASGLSGYAFHLQWTNNPAWVFYDLMLHPRYGLGRYISEDKVDKWALYTIARYCDGVDGDGNFVGVDDGNGGFEPRFTCNLYIADSQDAYRVLQDLASTFRGMVFWGAGTITAAQDSPKSPLFLFNDANVIDGSFSYSGTSRKSRHSMALVAFNDPANFYAQDIEVVDDQSLIERFGVREYRVTAFGCTSRSQANRVGRWLLTTERLETQTVTFRTPIEGARVKLGDIIDIRDRYKSTNRMGGRVQSVDIVAGTLTVDGEIILTADAHTLLVAVGAGGVRELTITDGAGTYQTVNVTGDLTDIVAPGVWILRNDTVEPFTARVIEVKELESHVFEITALEYVDAKYAEVEDGVTAVSPPTSDLPSDEAPSAPTNLQIEEIIVDTPAGTQRQLYLSWAASVSSYIKGYKVEVRAPGRDWETVDEQHKPTTYSGIPITSLGDYAIRVSTVSYSLVLSQPLESTYTAAAVSAPSPCTSLSATAGPELIDLRWTNPDDIDLLTVEIYESTTSNLVDATLIQSLLATRYIRTTLTSGAQRWYWVRAINRSRLGSTYTGPVNATAQNGPVAALTVASGKNKSYFQATAPDPATVTLVTGDIWFDSAHGNKIYQWSGSAWVAVQRVLDTSDFGTGIRPVELVATLPSTGNFQGRVVLLTTDNKVYRWTSATTTGTTYWTAAVPAADVTGQLTNAQIADLAATKITGSLTNSQIADLAATKITGTLTDAQIAALAATKITGTLTDAQLAAIAAAKITGTLTNSQIADLAATKITGTLTDSQLAAIAAAKITGQIATTQISNNAITTGKLAAGAVTANEIAANTITAAKIAAGTITATEISSGAITTAKLAAGAVTATEIAAGAITTAKLAAGAVTANEIAANTITAAKIAAATITATQLAAGSVTANQLAAQSILATKLLLSDANNVFPDFDMEDDSYYTSSTGATFSFNTSTSGNMGRRYLTITNLTPAASVESNWFPVESSADYHVECAAFLQSSTAGSGTATASIEFGSMSGTGAVTPTRVLTVDTATDSTSSTRGTLDVATASNERRARFVFTRDTGGTANGRYGGAMIRRRANASLVVDGAITTVKIAAGAVTANEIAAATITATQLAAGSITTAKIAAGAVTANEIAAGAITTAKLAAGAVTANEIAANTITASQIATDAITAGKIQAGAITAAKIGSNEVIAVTANIKDGVITTAKISDLSVAKLTAGTISSKDIAIAGGSAGKIRSSNFVAGSTGWQIDGNGDAEFNSVTVRVSNLVTASGSALVGNSSTTNIATTATTALLARLVNIAFSVTSTNYAGAATVWHVTLRIYRETGTSTLIKEQLFNYTSSDGSVQQLISVTDLVPAGSYAYTGQVEASVYSGGATPPAYQLNLTSGLIAVEQLIK